MKNILKIGLICLAIFGFFKAIAYINNKVYEDCMASGEYTHETCYDVAYQH